MPKYDVSLELPFYYQIEANNKEDAEIEARKLALDDVCDNDHDTDSFTVSEIEEVQ
jgi:hypothetical protein